MKCRPSGRKDGNQCARSPRLCSSVAADMGVPPSAATLKSVRPAENTIVLFVLHVLPSNPTSGTVQTVRGEPPAASTRLMAPRTTNPIVRLSGDQKGDVAPSVPAIG